jgi:hypothetical protein
MKYRTATAIAFSALAFWSVSSTTPASAACGPVCVAKCKASAHDVQACIQRWSKLNEDPALARRTAAQFLSEHPEQDPNAYKKFLPKKRQ